MERETEAFWKGEFGNSYTVRNHQADITGTIKFFSNILGGRTLEQLEAIQTILEVGANIGTNLAALHHLLPWSATSGVELNAEACRGLLQNADNVHNGSFLDYPLPGPYDLVLSKGVLIHIAPEDLRRAYQVIYEASQRWILIAEYYSPTPVEKDYRGHRGKLWKRDFAGELMDLYPDLKLVDYGFAYHRDPHPQDDITWFLLLKSDPQSAAA